jgi:hypothetical protein
MLTRQHFELIAATIASEKVKPMTDAERVRLQNLACRFADQFEANNPRFNRERFINACGFLTTRPIRIAA